MITNTTFPSHLKNRNSLKMEILITTSIILSTYWHYRYQGVPGGDAGELLAESCQAGTPHPPGYPLTIILNRFVLSLQQYFSTGNSSALTPAVVINTFNSLLGTLTAYIIAHSVKRLLSMSACSHEDNHDKLFYLSGALAGIAFALTPLVLEYSVGAEVFALNNLLTASIIYCTIEVASSLECEQKWHKKREIVNNVIQTNVSCRNHIYIGSFLCGLVSLTSLLFDKDFEVRITF